MISALPFAPPEQLDQVHLKTNDRTWTNFWNLPCLYNKKHFWILTKSYFLTKFYNISQHSPALLTRSLQFWLDFSSIVHLFDQVFELLREKASQLKSAGHRKFSAELVEYAERQWQTGLFTKQDWNLFNINVLMVPATNNGNEVWCTCIFNFFVKKMGGKKLLINISLKPQGTNGRLSINFGLHPNFWKFLRCCAALFLRAETDIRELLFASNSFKNILFLFLLPLFLLRSGFVFFVGGYILVAC